MTEPYSRIGLTSEQYSALRRDANLNSDVMRLIKPKILRDLQQTRSMCKLELSLGQRTKPRSVTDLSSHCRKVPKLHN